MSKKRTADESINEEEPTAEDDVTPPHEDTVKRARFSFMDVTLQDLPVELQECILIKAVVSEVKDLKLVKSVWKEKVDLVIGRLQSVSTQWSSILTTNVFRKKVDKILDDTDGRKIRLEMLDEFPINVKISAMTSLKDDIFMYYRQRDSNVNFRLHDDKDTAAINVYDRNNMGAVKDTIALPGKELVRMAACSVSNCVYVGLQGRSCLCLNLFRISKDAGDKFSLSPWINNLSRSVSIFSVSANGNLITLSIQQGRDPNIVSIHNADGVLQHEIQLSADIDAFRYKNILQKSNGNLVLAYVSSRNYQIALLEIDVTGNSVRKYQSSFSEESFVNVADACGRIMITEPHEGILLLDSEFNAMGIYTPQQDEDKRNVHYDMHYESERNEIVRIHYDWNASNNAVTVFRFVEDY